MVFERDKQQSAAAVYDLAAAGYDRPPLRFFHLGASRLVKLVGLPEGAVVLDVATGTGAAALAAARAVGPAGRVVGVDLAREMLAQAKRNVKAAGHANVELQVGDAACLDFRDESFDVVLCASSIFFLPDLSAGLRAWLRVLKPGGCLAFSGFGDHAFQPMSDLFEARIRRYGVPLPATGRPFSWQRLTQPALYHDLLRDAGCEQVELHAAQLGYHLRSVDEWWDVVWNSGFRGPVSHLALPDLERFKTEHLAEVAELAGARGIWLDISAIFALARKPPAVGRELTRYDGERQSLRTLRAAIP